jgi:predicted CopG family antitoxin
MKPVKIILSPEAEETYSKLEKEAEQSKTSKMILEAINKKKELIRINPHYGEPVAKKLIPKEYLEKYQITNLFHVELPGFWRMNYTLTNNETKLEIIHLF